MAQCQAYAHRYVGKGKDRVKFEGPCVLEERGHDGECLPASLAYANVSITEYNQGVAEALSKAMIALGELLPVSTDRDREVAAQVANTVRDQIEALKKAPIG